MLGNLKGCGEASVLWGDAPVPWGGGGYSSEFLVGVCHPGLQIPTLFQT